MRREQTAGLEIERGLWAHGYRRIVGIDEAGRGAWAGPVMAGAVCLPPESMSNGTDLRAILVGVRDSKQMTARARASLFDHITSTALAWGIGSSTAAEIDTIGIVPATCLAMRRAVETLIEHFPNIAPDYLLLDSIRCTIFELTLVDVLPTQALVRGDSLSLSIASASILAKVTRDRYMVEQDAAYPDYGFAIHKGYGVSAHQRAIAEQGASPIHRMSFAPLRAAADAMYRVPTDDNSP